MAAPLQNLTSGAAADLGLGVDLQNQTREELENQRKKRLADQMAQKSAGAAAQSPAYQSLLGANGNQF